MYEMDKKSKILIVIVFVLIILFALATFYRTMVLRDFPVINNSAEQ